MDNQPTANDHQIGKKNGIDRLILNGDTNTNLTSKNFDSALMDYSALYKNVKSELLQFYTSDNGQSFTIAFPHISEIEESTDKPDHLFSILFSNGEIPTDVLTILKNAYNTNTPDHQLIHIEKDKLNKWVELNFTRISDSQLIGYCRDVTYFNSLIQDYEINKLNYLQLQDNVPVGLFQINNDGEFSFTNKWIINILGYQSADELNKILFGDLFLEPEKYNNIRECILRSGRIGETEVKLKHSSKGFIWAVLNAQCIYDNNKQIESIDGYIYDITERKTALGKLKESEQMFRTISQNIKSAIYIFNDSGEFIYCNPAATEITGFSKNEILKMKFFDVIHPDFRDIVKQRGVNRVQGKNAPKSYEFKILTKSKEEKWMEIRASKLIINGKSAVLGLANDITERKLMLDTLRSSEEKYKSLYSFFRLMADNVPDMIWSKNLDKEYIFTNKALANKMLKVDDVNEPIGKTQEYFAEKERAKKPGNKDWFTFGELCPDSDEIVLQNKRYQSFDEYGTVNGEFIHLDVHKSPLIDETGKIIGIVGSARDVTQQKRLEEERKRDEQIRHMVYKISNAINTTKDLNELLTVIRLELSQVINTKNLFIALYDKNNDKLSLPYFVDEKDRFIELPSKKTLTHYLIRKNKPLLLRAKEIKELLISNDIEVTGSMAKVWLGVPLNINDEIIGALVLQNYRDENAFTFRDLELMQFVSSQISISINQKQADDALRVSEFALRQIIDNVPVKIFAKDKKLRFVLANQALANAYESRVEDIEGMKQSDIHSVSEEVIKYEHDDKLLLQGKTDRIETEESFTDATGEVRILKTVKVPFESLTDKGIAILGVAIDITDSKQTEIDLKNAKDKAEESDKLKTAFLANMSHEIRTPMNAIIGFSELLNDPELTIETRKEFIGLIADNSKVLLNLIEDIIDVAKIEARQVKIIESTCQVNAIMDELGKNYTRQLSKYGHKNIDLRINKEIDDENFALISDPFRFKQIMKNLIGNAIKFTENGFVEIGYRIEKNEKIIFYVKDSGIGLARDKTSLIFERFRQAEESSTKEYGGTGLGLTISKRLVEMLGGELWVESVLHEGSTFYFSLPYRLASTRIKMKQNTGKSGKQDWTGKTILVAEDELSNYELIKATLYRTNANVIRAVNGKEAVEICSKNEKIDLILMDIRMPEMNGYEATRIIKSVNKEMPIISLTAYAMSDDKEKSFKAGCDEYISKPFNPVDLLEIMNRYIK